MSKKVAIIGNGGFGFSCSPIEKLHPHEPVAFTGTIQQSMDRERGLVITSTNLLPISDAKPIARAERRKQKRKNKK